MSINRRHLIATGAALGFTSAIPALAFAEEADGPPLRFDWMPQVINYNSSRSNRGKRPSLNAIITGIARPEGGLLFQETTAPAPFLSAAIAGETGGQVAGSVRFQMPGEGPARQRFDLRISRLDRSLRQFLGDLGEPRVPASTEFGLLMDVGRAHYEFSVPLREILADADRNIPHRLLIRGAVARAGDTGQILAFFDPYPSAAPEPVIAPAARSRGAN